MTKKSSFLEEKTFSSFKIASLPNWEAQNMPVVAGRLVPLSRDWDKGIQKFLGFTFSLVHWLENKKKNCGAKNFFSDLRRALSAIMIVQMVFLRFLCSFGSFLKLGTKFLISDKAAKCRTNKRRKQKPSNTTGTSQNQTFPKSKNCLRNYHNIHCSRWGIWEQPLNWAKITKIRVVFIFTYWSNFEAKTWHSPKYIKHLKLHTMIP